MLSLIKDALLSWWGVFVGKKRGLESNSFVLILNLMEGEKSKSLLRF